MEPLDSLRVRAEESDVDAQWDLGFMYLKPHRRERKCAASGEAPESYSNNWGANSIR